MRKLITTVMLLLAPAPALAGGYVIPNSNPRDLGLAQGDVAAQSGPEAVFQNTAALAGQKGLAISASLELLFNATSWSDPVLGAADINKHVNTPPALSVGYGGSLSNGMNYGFGAIFMVPGGGSLYWPYDWAGATRIQSVDQKVYTGQVGAAFEPVKGLKLGARAVYYQVTEKLVQQINFVDVPGNATLGLAGGGLSYGVSGEFTILPLTLGVDYQHKADLKLTGNAHFEGVPATFQPALLDQGATEYVTIPNILYLGAAVTLAEGFRVMASYNLEVWTAYKSDTFIGDKGFTVSVPRNYQNAYVVRLAAEYAHLPFLPALTLRAGAFRSISEQPTDTLSPTLSDSNSWAFSVGAGYDLSSGLRLDLAWLHAMLDSITATGIETLPGTYDTKVDFLSAGLTYRADL